MTKDYVIAVGVGVPRCPAAPSFVDGLYVVHGEEVIDALPPDVR